MCWCVCHEKSSYHVDADDGGGNGDGDMDVLKIDIVNRWTS